MTRRTIPSWLIAETLAWPLVARAAYQQSTVQLARVHVGALAPDTARLAEALDEWLRPRASGASLEALASMRHALWFRDEARSAPLEEYLVGIARARVHQSGATALLRPDTDGTPAAPEAVERWHWLCRALPADLIIAARAASDQSPPVADHVTLDAPGLASALERRVAETHLHVGAAVSFPLLWTGLMVSGHTLHPRGSKLARGGPLPFADNRDFLTRILTASVARITMAGFLSWRRATGQNHGFAEFWRTSALGLTARIPWPMGAHALRRDWSSVLLLVTRASETRPWARVRALARHVLAAVNAARGRPDESDARAQDPLTWLLCTSATGTRAAPETHFAQQSIQYLCGPGRADAAFRCLFWQYQRIRGMTFRHLVHQPGTGGLDWFARHYQRISALRAPLGPKKYLLGLAHQSPGIGLDSFEARTSPESTWYENWREVRDFARQARTWNERSDNPCEVGLVLHFVKAARCRCGRLHTDPAHAAFSARCGVWFTKARKQARAVAQMLEYAPQTLLILRGIDVANVELALPNWVLAPLFHELLHAAEQAAQTLTKRYPGLPEQLWRGRPPLRATCHAGEDYRCVSEGLRRVHELSYARILRASDRIGHGLVLGDALDRDPAVDGCAFQPAEDQLDDLLWEWERYATDHVPPPNGRLPFLEKRIDSLARMIYGPSVPDHALSRSHLARAGRWRHHPQILARLGYPDCRKPLSSDPAMQLLWLYLTDSGVFERGQRSREVARQGDTARAALAALQEWLTERLARDSITIESNPTSNMAIGDMADITRHPSFVMQPLDQSAPGGIPVSINTDNPLTFTTRLADEYAYLCTALLRRRDVTASQVRNWLERARRSGWDSRFTLPLARRPEVLKLVLEALS